MIPDAHRIIHADNLAWMQSQPDNICDFTFTSPPYADARQYSIGFKMRDSEWVDWMVSRTKEMVRLTDGLVGIVIEGRTRDFSYDAIPMHLAVELHKLGYHLRKPAAYHRIGIPGSGSIEGLRNDWEFVLLVSKYRKLPWSHNSVMGTVPKFPAGGNPSHRKRDGKRVSGKPYVPPEKTNPGNVVKETYTFKEVQVLLQQYESGNVVHCNAGGGHMGDNAAHQNEAPFPESLAEFFIRSYCPQAGTVFDPFAGSGTCMDVAIQRGRKSINIDIREDQCKIMYERKSRALSDIWLRVTGDRVLQPATKRLLELQSIVGSRETEE